MHVFDRSTASGTVQDAVEVTRWEQFSAAGQLPFGGMWYTVAPNSASRLDQHPDIELSLVLTGDAEVEHADGTTTIVRQGSAFLLESEESHVVHNTSADTPLVIFSAYWIPSAHPESGDAGTDGA